MTTRKTIRSLSRTATRWTAWSSRLAARYQRWADATRRPLLLHARWRMPALLMQRWCSFHADFHTLVNISAGGHGTRPRARPHAGASQMEFSPARSLLQRHGLQAAHQARQAEALARRLEFQRAAPTPAAAGVLWGAMPAAIARTQREHLASTFGRHVSPQYRSLTFSPHMPPHHRFSVSPTSSILRRHELLRHDAEPTQVSRLLARRLRRVSEAFPNMAPMALRKQPAPPVAPRLPPAEALTERSSFERRVPRPGDAPPAVPAVSVEQLTSQVLKHIDRRVIARRERMGQV
jgi:hypothetical protein